MQKKKMLEKQAAKLDGQMILLEQQKMMIEQSLGDASVFSALSDASKATEQLNKQLDIDKLEDIKEKLDDQRADMEEKTEFFVQAANIEDQDDLLAELDELEAEQAAEELESIEIGKGAVNAGKGGAIAQPNMQKTKSAQEDDELKQLEMMMA